MDKMISFAPVDAACDMMAKKFIHDSLPPYLDPSKIYTEGLYKISVSMLRHKRVSIQPKYTK